VRSLGQPTPSCRSVPASPDGAQNAATRFLRGTLVEAYGKIRLYTIAEKGSRAGGGEHVATIGPLMTEVGKKYAARYMEAVFSAGM
jgi:hypothetical protein